MRKPHAELLSLDVLALSLLCCLLASVVAILVLNDDSKAKAARVAVGRRADQLTGAVSQTRNSLDNIAAKLSLSSLERQSKIKGTELDEVRRKIELRLKIAEAEAETARLEKQLKDVAQNMTDDPAMHPVFGNYRGAYVTVECLRDRIVVHPGDERIAVKFGEEPKKEIVSRLVEKISKAGFVLFVVRPSGWFKNSFDAVSPAVFKGLDRLKTEGGRPIGRATMPLEENVRLESIFTGAPSKK